MKNHIAERLLSRVMHWEDPTDVSRFVPRLQLLAEYKYDHYQRFGPGIKFIESLAQWLDQFDPIDREAALQFVLQSIIFISDQEFSHLVQTAYPDIIIQERIKLVAEEKGLDQFCVGRITNERRYIEYGLKSLYLGLSDGARTNELRRASNGEINNEQIWQAYEISDEKADDMQESLREILDQKGFETSGSVFNMIWLIDDFSGSGNTYIRYDIDEDKFKGKITKIYDRLHKSKFVDRSHYEVYLLLYIATRQAINHIEFWANQFTSQNNLKPLQLRVLQIIEPEYSLQGTTNPDLSRILNNPRYVDQKAADIHFKKGGTTDPKYGFAGCALPIVLSHNTPNNSVYILWGPENYSFHGLFPRISRHREF